MAIERIVVPVIDLANFPDELEKLAAASTGLGCFRVINHGMPVALLSDMKATVRSLFDIPTEVKLRNVVNIIDGGGYLPPERLGRLFESFGIYDATSPADVDSFCSVLDSSPKQHKIISEYISKLHGVAKEIASKVAESVGLAGCSFNEWSCHVRLNSCHYKEEESIGCINVPAHTDFGFLTVLQEDDCVDGFEILDIDGSFVAIDPVPGTLLVNIGDVAKIWSNGRLHNVMHRVVCKKMMSRTSMTLFILAPKDDKVELQTAFIDMKHPKLYRAFSYNEYRKIRHKSGLKAAEILSLLKADEEAMISDI